MSNLEDHDIEYDIDLTPDAHTPGVPYLWRVIYDDEGLDLLDEREADGTEHSTGEIRWGDVKALVLIPQRDGLVAHAHHYSPAQRPIFFRRKGADINGPNAGVWRTVTVAGWQSTIAGVNVKHLTAYYESGATLSTQDDDLIVA